MGLRTASVGPPDAPKEMAPALTEPQAPKTFELPHQISLDLQVNKTKQLPSYQSRPTRNGPAKALEALDYPESECQTTKTLEQYLKSSPSQNHINPPEKIQSSEEVNFEESLSAFKIFKSPPISSSENHNYSPTSELRKEPLNPIDVLTTQLNLAELNSLTKKSELDRYLTPQGGASENHLFSQNMSESPVSQELPTMGLQKTESLTSNLSKNKTSNEIDQLFDANVEDIMQQVMKHIGGDQLNNSASDLNEVLDLNIDKDLLDNIDMNMSIDDQQDDLETAHKIKENQAKNILTDLHKKHDRIERRLEFLRRRAAKLQSRYMGQQVSGEVSGVFEYVQRTLKKSKFSEQTIHPPPDTLEKMKPLSVNAAKSLAKKLEATTTMQANTAARLRNVPKYFGSGSIETTPASIRGTVGNTVCLPTWNTSNRQELQKVSRQLRTQLRVVQKVVDSEATESSSGGESCDEMQVYSNPHQQYLTIQKRALWRYSQDRAAIASRWTWLQSQISDLEYRIRQHSEFHKQIRTAKGPIQLAENLSSPTASLTPSIGERTEDSCTTSTVNGYKGQLPGATPSVSGKSTEGETECEHCARTRPLISFKKRKLLQVSGLHAVSKKAARPSTVRCSCTLPSTSCALCTGRTDPTFPRDSTETLSKAEKVSRLDPGFHPVLSLPQDSSQSLHLEAVMKMYEWQQRSARIKTMKASSKESRVDSKNSMDSNKGHKEYKYKKKYKYGKHKSGTVAALSEKIKKKLRGRKAGRPLKYKKDFELDGKPLKDQPNFSSTLSLTSTIHQEEKEDEEVEAAMESGTRTPILDNTTRSSFDSPGGSPLLQMQSISGFNRQHRNSRIDSYDIDNIVIPYSVAAATRVEKLQYKEILTPKWRIAQAEYPDVSNKSVPDFSLEDSDVEDVSEESITVRHERSEQEERKKFLSYLKMPFGGARQQQRSHKRQDSMAESSGGNTPDPMSPHPPGAMDVPSENPASESKPETVPSFSQATPGSSHSSQINSCGFEEGHLPSIALMRRRTISQTRFKEFREELGPPPDFVEAPPYENRVFPIPEAEYDDMVKDMPETHQAHQTNTRAQDFDSIKSVDSGDTESTESALGEECEDEIEDEEEDADDEDPNDPEWIDVEKAAREKHHHRR